MRIAGLAYGTVDGLQWGRKGQGGADFFDLKGDVETLLNFKAEAPGMPYAHPTIEHFIPLFVTLGASGNPEKGVESTIDGYRVGFSKRSFQAA